MSLKSTEKIRTVSLSQNYLVVIKKASETERTVKFQAQAKIPTILPVITDYIYVSYDYGVL